MCSGPVRIKWHDQVKVSSSLDIDERLVILCAADLAEVDRNEPHVAQFNEMDFFFLVREDIPSAAADITFWFPYPSDEGKGMTWGCNNISRTREYLPIYLARLQQGLQNPFAESPESLGWNEDSLTRVLPERPTEHVAQVMLDELQRLKTLEEFALDTQGLWVERLLFDGDQQEAHQHFVAHLSGKLRKGDFFHIFFKTRRAIAKQLDTYTGQSLFYYYDSSYEPVVHNHPFASSPLVPCAALHVELRFSHPIRELTDGTGSKASWVSSHHLSDTSMLSPTGFRYDNTYWFTIFNAHLGSHGKNFLTRWQFWEPSVSEPRIPPENWGNGTVLQDYGQQSQLQRQIIREVVTQLCHPGLMPAESLVLRSVADGKNLRQVASERNLALKTVRNYYSSALAHLGLTKSRLDSFGRRQVVIFSVRLYDYLVTEGLDLNMLAEDNSETALL